MMDANTWSFLWGCISGIGLGAGVMFALMFDYYELTQRMKRVMWTIIYKERK